MPVLATASGGRLPASIAIGCQEVAEIVSTQIDELLHRHHGRAFYLDAVEFVAFTQQAIDYAATAPMKLVDGAQLEKSMLRSLAGVPQLPMRCDAMCCQCGSTIQHRLDRAEAILAITGMPCRPYRAGDDSAEGLSGYQRRRAMRLEAQLIRVPTAVNRRMGSRLRPGR